MGTTAVLEASRMHGVRKFIYISSAEVYGRPEAAVVAEEHPSDPVSPYGAAKASAELLIRAFAAQCDFSSVILRPFSVYGRGASPESVIGTIVRMIRSSQAIVLNDLEPVRDYCHVNDVVNAVLLACAAEIEGVVTLNIGSGKGTSVGELANLLAQLAGKSVPVQKRADAPASRRSDIVRLVADRTRAREILGWEPTITLESGLRGIL
jgi:UDP-glucose 4-epimerase